MKAQNVLIIVLDYAIFIQHMQCVYPTRYRLKGNYLNPLNAMRYTRFYFVSLADQMSVI